MLKDRSSIGHVCMLSASVLWGLMAIIVSLAMGIGVFGLRQAFATALVFVGVWFMVRNKEENTV
ncbi:hypothetical protein SAMN05444369_113102 [Capnocytophaga haemolytica]|uniref:EamA domain-containing protein n=1 Tax=Capnocytophaga haemolytica TaxID=45243 RepID=A0AAX2GZA5_9FLAO|nr:hypothetical protein [Capnocytophaga haemolytica]AMD84630.1 hypothetical protein AXF12_03285 [Capnocytophaga haemolytica]SFO22152.1 hypothetical protein SAMN05444369_113102 [Capnocytophaga haemolytica]SNV08831.1 Uncharacterised protein [Capnocytophaga haemolytica]